MVTVCGAHPLYPMTQAPYHNKHVYPRLYFPLKNVWFKLESFAHLKSANSWCRANVGPVPTNVWDIITPLMVPGRNVIRGPPSNIAEMLWHRPLIDLEHTSHIASTAIRDVKLYPNKQSLETYMSCATWPPKFTVNLFCATPVPVENCWA